jgi:formate hydrogenlyase transcriptional activator
MHQQPVQVGLIVPLSEVPAGWVVEHQKPARVVIDTNSPQYPVHHFNMSRAGLGVSFHLPLTTPHARLGELIFSFREVVEVPESEMQFMQRVADQVALAIENANNLADARRAQRDVEHRNRQREQLLELTNNIVSHLDLNQVLRIAARGVRKIVPCAICAVALPEPDGKHLRLCTLEFPAGKGLLQEGLRMPIDGSNVGRAFRTREVIVLDGPATASYSPEMYRIVTGEGLKAQVFVPLVSRGESLGALGMSRTEDGLFTADEVEYLKHVAAQITIAIENAMQFEQVRAAEREVARERDRKQLLLELTNSAISQLGLQEVLDVVAKGVRRVVPSDLAIVSLVHEDSDALCVQAIDFPEGRGFIQKGLGVPMIGSLADRAFRAGSYAVMNQIEPQNYAPGMYERFMAEGIKRQCYVPFGIRGRFLGDLGLMRRDEISFTQDEVDFLVHVAGQVAIAVENALQFDRVRAAEREVARERDRKQLLLEVNNAVVSHLDLGELVKSISVSLGRVVPHDAAAFSLYDEKTGKIQGIALHREFDDKGVFEHGKWISADGLPEGEAIATRKPVLVRQADIGRFHSPLMQKAHVGGVRSGCAVPLIAHGRLFGLLSVVSLQENAFSDDDALLLDQCSSQIAIALENALAYREIAALKNRLAQEKLYLEDEIRSEINFEEIIGESPALRTALQQVQTVAASDSTVLILGETGTGKELIARAIHEASRRKGRTFVKLNCAAIPTGLLESELFGHERGAFTGAIAQKIGRMELANGGTLFLDEVGDIPLELQPKLLRALQEREFERLGSVRTQKSDVRFLAATNRDLPEMVAEKQFRSDLFYRLNVFPISIPALRDRRDDIPRLVRYFVSKYAKKMDKRIETIPAAAMHKLQAWHWPGNVRELENFIERSVILTSGPVLHVPLAELESADLPEAAPVTLKDSEREHILKVLRDTKGILAGPAGAAARLGVKRTTLQYKMKKLGITRDSL